LQVRHLSPKGRCGPAAWAVPFMTKDEVDTRIRALIEPFNKKGVAITDETTFQNDLEFDSLTVMDFVAEIEDEFDIIITMNQQAEIETYGQLVDAVHKLQDS
jgi:acyl carrier protein